MGCHFLLQGIFPSQGSNLNLCLLHWWASSLALSHWRSPTSKLPPSKSHIQFLGALTAVVLTLCVWKSPEELISFPVSIPTYSNSVGQGGAWDSAFQTSLQVMPVQLACQPLFESLCQPDSGPSTMSLWLEAASSLAREEPRHLDPTQPGHHADQDNQEDVFWRPLLWLSLSVKPPLSLASSLL